MKNTLFACFRVSSDGDTYMQLARALKREKQIYPDEVRHLIKKLGGALARVQYVDKRRKIPRSSFSALEVETCLNTLRAILLALEILNRSREREKMSAALREQAGYKLCYAISQL
ncbi:MAG TPA: hypothetical protein VKP65_08530 [Rhodothermales bacterium]|nr:hypothetical protein [Rhodothermales bacterium]